MKLLEPLLLIANSLQYLWAPALMMSKVSSVAASALVPVATEVHVELLSEYSIRKSLMRAVEPTTVYCVEIVAVWMNLGAVKA